MSDEEIRKIFSCCRLCPRECGANRYEGEGFCRAGVRPVLAKAMLHMWEEPVLSAAGGAGAVFFSHCTMKCVYCQNYTISAGGFGREVSTEALSDIFLKLEQLGAQNIDLVTPTHYLPCVIAALDRVRHRLKIPVVYNCGGYESAEAIRMLDGYVDIYLPDVKYFDDGLARRYSSAPGYFRAACGALSEMLRQVGKPEYEGAGARTADGGESCAEGAGARITDITEAVTGMMENPEAGLCERSIIDGRDCSGADASSRYAGPDPDSAAQVPVRAAEVSGMGSEGCNIMKKGVIVRHMVLPAHREDSAALLKGLFEAFGSESFLISLLSQYTPFYLAKSDPAYKSINRRVFSCEYDAVVNMAVNLGFKGFMQEKSSAKEEYTPEFNLEGVCEGM